MPFTPVGGGGLPYRHLDAYLYYSTQFNEVTLFIIQNTLKGTPTFTKLSTGSYSIVLNGETGYAIRWVLCNAFGETNAGELAFITILSNPPHTINIKRLSDMTPVELKWNTGVIFEIRVYD